MKTCDASAASDFFRADHEPVRWHISTGLTPYDEALARMEELASGIAAGTHEEEIWLVEHPPLYTAGTSANPRDLMDPQFPVYETGRGGQYTYHGPGQRVAYAMLDLSKRRADLRVYVAALESWIIETLSEFSIIGERREDRVGVWVKRPDKGAGYEDKIAAIGIRVRKWVSFHGISLNVEPELSHFKGIVPCGISEHRYGVTSLVDLGLPVTMTDADIALRRGFERIFGPTKGI